MRLQAIPLTCLLNFWEANPGAPDSSYETGHTIGLYCIGPALLILIVYALYKRSGKKGPNK